MSLERKHSKESRDGDIFSMQQTLLMKSSKYDILFANFGHFKILCQDSLHVRLHELILHVRLILMAAVCSYIAAVVTDIDVTAARQNDLVFSTFYTGNLSGFACMPGSVICVVVESLLSLSCDMCVWVLRSFFHAVRVTGQLEDVAGSSCGFK